MSIRLDPRRLNALKLLAAEAGVRPGELVTSWVEERLDAARAGGAIAAPAQDPVRSLSARVDELARRLDALAASSTAAIAVPEAAPEQSAPKRRTRAAATEAAPAAAEIATIAEPRRKRGTGGPTVAVAAGKPKTGRKAAAKVALHDEISAVIGERGPMSAAELAAVITERGLYQQPRSARPLDAATVNARVSNPRYRPQFVRREGKVGLAAS